MWLITSNRCIAKGTRELGPAGPRPGRRGEQRRAWYEGDAAIPVQVRCGHWAFCACVTGKEARAGYKVARVEERVSNNRRLLRESSEFYFYTRGVLNNQGDLLCFNGFNSSAQYC